MKNLKRAGIMVKVCALTSNLIITKKEKKKIKLTFESFLRNKWTVAFRGPRKC
jgi:hypothetical protein